MRRWPTWAAGPADERQPRDDRAAGDDRPDGGRFQDASDDCATTLSELGQSLSVGASVTADATTFETDGVVGLGSSHRLDGEYRRRFVVTYDHPEAVDVEVPSDFDDWIDTSGIRDAEVTVDGRVARLEGTANAREANFPDPMP